MLINIKTNPQIGVAYAARLAGTLALAMALTACGKHEEQQAPPAVPEVGVVTLASQPVPLTTDLPGRTTAYRVAEIRPQVSGVILKRLFIEGGEVKAGQQLYQIDPAPFQANVDSAAAALSKAQASLISAKLLSERYRPLAEAHAVSQQDFDNAVASEAGASADVASAKAALETARINLLYTKVLSPISGRSGRSAVTEGALVDANQSTALVVVQQLDPIYVDVTQPSTLLLRLQREMSSGLLQGAGGDNQAAVKLTLEDGSPYDPAGKMQFSEVTVDAGTGSVTLRAVFPNPQHWLLPGMFVHEQIEEGVRQQALLVPQQGVTYNQRGEATALVVGAGNALELRALKAERAIADQWLVSDGVKAGEQVVVQGLQTVHPGMVVKPTEIKLGDAAKAPADASPAAAKQ